VGGRRAGRRGSPTRTCHRSSSPGPRTRTRGGRRAARRAADAGGPARPTARPSAATPIRSAGRRRPPRTIRPTRGRGRRDGRRPGRALWGRGRRARTRRCRGRRRRAAPGPSAGGPWERRWQTRRPGRLASATLEGRTGLDAAVPEVGRRVPQRPAAWMASPTGRLSDAPQRLWPGCALARGRHLGLGRGPVPPCLGASGGGGPRLLPPELGGLAGRPLQLIHPLPGCRNESAAEEQDAAEPQETADPNERTSAHQESPVELNASLGCLIGHAVTPLSRAGGRLAVPEQPLVDSAGAGGTTHHPVGVIPTASKRGTSERATVGGAWIATRPLDNPDAPRRAIP